MESRRRRRIDLPIIDLCADLPRGIGGIIVDRDPLPPRHLAPLADMLERAFSGKPLRACFSAAVQHAKTSAIQFAIAQAIARDPRIRVCYASYVAAQAVDRSKQIREVATALGVELKDDVNSGALWRTTSGGFLLAGGTDAGFVGKTIDCAIVDDPYKSRAEAESQAHRDRVEAMIRVLCDRSTAVLITHARWHPDDAIGVRANDRAWEHVNLAAICEEEPDPLGRKIGDALWPQVKPPAFFDEAKRDAYDWASLYQGRPRPRGGAVFGTASFCDALPLDRPVRYAIGVDLAYTRSVSADYSAAVVLGRVESTIKGGDPDYYVLDVLRVQERAPVVARLLCGLRQDYPGTPLVMYASGTERGTIDMMGAADLGVRVPITAWSASRDKFLRAQPLAAAWNAGRVHLLRRGGSWVDSAVLEFGRFTGVDDRHDDIVDAMAAAYDALKRSPIDLAALLGAAPAAVAAPMAAYVGRGDARFETPSVGFGDETPVVSRTW